MSSSYHRPTRVPASPLRSQDLTPASSQSHPLVHLSYSPESTRNPLVCAPQPNLDSMSTHHPTTSGFEYIHFDQLVSPGTRGGTEHEGSSPNTSEGVVTARDFASPAAPAQHATSPVTYPASAVTAFPPSQSHSPSLSLDEKPARASRLANRRTRYQRMESTQPMNNSRVTLRFADGDFIKPDNGFSRFWMSIFESSIIVRWFFFITPVLLIIWIPGILGLTLEKSNLQVWGVELVWWSAWLSVAWGGWWIGLAFGMLAPHLFKYTIGVILPPSFVQKWVGYLTPMKNAIMGAVWSFLSWLSFNLFILKHKTSQDTEGDDRILHWIIQALFGMFLSSLLLVAEKFLIQIIATNFHRRSYEDRITEQKHAIRTLVTLYMNSHDIGRSDTLDRGYLGGGKAADPAKLLRTALKGVQKVAKSTTTVFGTVASEIAGERILQPNSPSSMVLSALASPNKTRQLARRLYYSFVPTHYRTVMVVSDISKFFDTEEQAREAFSTLDKDENGDASLEEIELSCYDLHRERLALGSSMRDLDSAVGRLDSILMFFWYFISLLVIIALLDVSFQTMLASAGTLTLGLSWLIGGTAQEILASVVFLFVKHPYDIGDRVDIDKVTYFVKEMHLLYTVFRQTDGTINQLPHSVLNTKRIVNIRRSGPISEPFTWEVDFNTPFEKIQALSEKMLAFLQAERRDFIPSIDISVEDFEGQAKMTLKSSIKYKSNWQNHSLKVQRRNKWICALKQVMAELEMWGPSGAGDPAPPDDVKIIKILDNSAGLSSRPTARKSGSCSTPSGAHTPVKSFQFGTSTTTPDLWLDEVLDTAPPLLPPVPSAHVPMNTSNQAPPQFHSTADMEMQYQRRT